VLQELFGEQWWTRREFVLLVTAVFILLPLVLHHSVGKFTFQLRRALVEISRKENQFS